MKRLLLTLLLLAGSLGTLRAARIDTLRIASRAMPDKRIETLVVVPDDAHDCPTVYLLHGYGGNARTWLTIRPDLVETAQREGWIIVCPDGAASWWWDSPVLPDMQYESFAAELVGCIDARYPTRPVREARAITGLSMGGHGALWLALRHKELFGSVGSTSGGVDVRPFPGNWERERMLGCTYAERPEVWDAHTVVEQLDGLRDGELRIIFDCGVDDFFADVNRDLHRRLLERGIGHDFILRPGAHTSEYWCNALDYQLLFFRKGFARNR